MDEEISTLRAIYGEDSVEARPSIREYGGSACVLVKVRLDSGTDAPGERAGDQVHHLSLVVPESYPLDSDAIVRVVEVSGPMREAVRSAAESARRSGEGALFDIVSAAFGAPGTDADDDHAELARSSDAGIPSLRVKAPRREPGATSRAEHASDRPQKDNASAGKSRSGAGKATLRPAHDVITRIMWDPAMDQDDFVVGYLDRFCGVVERAFSSFDWSTPLAEAEWHALAIPRHRIEYFKCRGSIVWSKRDRIDLIFGTGESPQAVFLGRRDQPDSPALVTATSMAGTMQIETMQRTWQEHGDSAALVAEHERAGQRSARPIAPFHAAPQASTPERVLLSRTAESVRRQRPTHFVCLPLGTDPDVAMRIDEVVRFFLGRVGGLQGHAIPPVCAHVTLCMLELRTPEEITAASQVLADSAEILRTLMPLDMPVHLGTLERFGSHCVYSRVCGPGEALLGRAAELLAARFVAAGASIAGTYPEYNPHATIFKGQGLGDLGEVAQQVLDVAGAMTVGVARARSVALCRCGRQRDPDGFYVRDAALSLRAEVQRSTRAALEQLLPGLSVADNRGLPMRHARNKPLVLILRGLPGVGKSTFARRLAALCPELHVVSADAFAGSQGGRARAEAHALCMERYIHLLETHVPFIVVDNTNILSAHYRGYVAEADARHADTMVIELRRSGGYASRRDYPAHVPADRFESMLHSFQGDSSAVVLEVPHCSEEEATPDGNEGDVMGSTGLGSVAHAPGDMSSETVEAMRCQGPSSSKECSLCEAHSRKETADFLEAEIGAARVRRAREVFVAAWQGVVAEVTRSSVIPCAALGALRAASSRGAVVVIAGVVPSGSTAQQFRESVVAALAQCNALGCVDAIALAPARAGVTPNETTAPGEQASGDWRSREGTHAENSSAQQAGQHAKDSHCAREARWTASVGYAAARVASQASLRLWIASCSVGQDGDHDCPGMQRRDVLVCRVSQCSVSASLGAYGAGFGLGDYRSAEWLAGSESRDTIFVGARGRQYRVGPQRAAEAADMELSGADNDTTGRDRSLMPVSDGAVAAEGAHRSANAPVWPQGGDLADARALAFCAGEIASRADVAARASATAKLSAHWTHGILCWLGSAVYGRGGDLDLAAASPRELSREEGAAALERAVRAAGAQRVRTATSRRAVCVSGDLLVRVPAQPATDPSSHENDERTGARASSCTSRVFVACGCARAALLCQRRACGCADCAAAASLARSTAPGGGARCVCCACAASRAAFVRVPVDVSLARRGDPDGDALKRSQRTARAAQRLRALVHAPAGASGGEEPEQEVRGAGVPACSDAGRAGARARCPREILADERGAFAAAVGTLAAMARQDGLYGPAIDGVRAYHAADLVTFAVEDERFPGVLDQHLSRIATAPLAIASGATQERGAERCCDGVRASVQHRESCATCARDAACVAALVELVARSLCADAGAAASSGGGGGERADALRQRTERRTRCLRPALERVLQRCSALDVRCGASQLRTALPHGVAVTVCVSGDEGALNGIGAEMARILRDKVGAQVLASVLPARKAALRHWSAATGNAAIARADACMEVLVNRDEGRVERVLKNLQRRFQLQSGIEISWSVRDAAHGLGAALRA